jgi:hypothetical protein
MRSFRRLASGVSQAAAARCLDFSLAMVSPSKKSLRAAERKRADVARARRRWIREQGFLDPAHLVFIGSARNDLGRLAWRQQLRDRERAHVASSTCFLP